MHLNTDSGPMNMVNLHTELNNQLVKPPKKSVINIITRLPSIQPEHFTV